MESPDGELCLYADHAERTNARDMANVELAKECERLRQALAAAEEQLATANALLGRWRVPATWGGILAATEAHLDAQPATPTDHDRAVLEAISNVPIGNVRALSGQLALKGLPELAQAELARREAKR